jgi:hypothetical protein
VPHEWWTDPRQSWRFRILASAASAPVEICALASGLAGKLHPRSNFRLIKPKEHCRNRLAKSPPTPRAPQNADQITINLFCAIVSLTQQTKILRIP